MIALLSIALLAQAQDVQPQDVPPPQPDIVVTGSGLAEGPGEAAYDVVTIERERLAASASESLESVLRDVAGVQQFRRSDSRTANPTSQGISLRGIGGNASSRALLLLDGVPQADPFGGYIAFPALVPDRLGRVRVTRGGGSGFQGPGALAGTIELESASPDQLSPFSGALSYGSRESVTVLAGSTPRLGAGFASVSGSYARGDGFVPIVEEDRGPADRRAPYEAASGAIRAVTPLGGDVELQANLAAFTDRRERGTAFTDIKSEGADASARIIGRGRWGFALLGYVQTRAFASQFVAVDAARTAATLTLDQYNVPATGLGGRFEIAPPTGEALTLRLGGDVRAVSGKTQELFTYVAGRPTRRREAGGESRTLGAFADASLALGAVTLSAGGRIDFWQIQNGFLSERPLGVGAAITDLRFADRDGSEATGRAGIAWQPADPVKLRAAGYRGWRLPTLNELYRPFRVGADATAANALLSPERLWGAEVGVDLEASPQLRASATLFWNRLDDAIANVSLANGPGVFPGVGFVSAAGVFRQRRNLEAIEVFGVELDGRAEVGTFGLSASYAFTDSEVSDGGALDGLRPAQTPRHQASATLDWTPVPAANAALTARTVSSQFEDDQNIRILGDAVTVDARIAVPLGAALTIEGRAENVFDETVEAAVSAAGVVERAGPRTLWIGLRYRPR